MKTICVLCVICGCLFSGCGYRLGLGPQRVADAGFSGPVIVDLKKPVL